MVVRRRGSCKRSETGRDANDCSGRDELATMRHDAGDHRAAAFGRLPSVDVSLPRTEENARGAVELRHRTDGLSRELAA